MFDILNSLIVSAEIRRQEGQGMVEYGLIVALVSVAAIVGLTLVGDNLQTMFNGIGALITAPA